MQASGGKYDDEPSGKFSATSPNDLSREQKSPKCGHQIIDTRLDTLVFFCNDFFYFTLWLCNVIHRLDYWLDYEQLFSSSVDCLCLVSTYFLRVYFKIVWENDNRKERIFIEKLVLCFLLTTYLFLKAMVHIDYPTSTTLCFASNGNKTGWERVE